MEIVLTMLAAVYGELIGPPTATGKQIAISSTTTLETKSWLKWYAKWEREHGLGTAFFVWMFFWCSTAAVFFGSLYQLELHTDMSVRLIIFVSIILTIAFSCLLVFIGYCVTLFKDYQTQS